MRKLLLITGLLLAMTLPAHAATVDLVTPTVQQGQTLIVAFDEQPTKVTLGKNALTPFPYQNGWRLVVPFSLGAYTGSVKLVTQFKTLRSTTGEPLSVTKTFRITRFTPNVINLPVPPKLNQTPKQLVQNLAVTNSSINSFVKTITGTTLFGAPFALPLTDNKISSRFGETRKTGTEKITHLGTDFDLPKGTPVAAINDGLVAKAYLDSVYGNSVIINHGRGIYSLYLHLDTLRVATGETVSKGAIVGTLGETGLASAPHLHLSIKINGVSVDPLQFVSSFR